MKPIALCFLLSWTFFTLCLPGDARGATVRNITDAFARQIQVPENVSRIICSGAGCLRLITYLRCQDKIVAVDDMEKRRRKFDARPYALANPQFKQYPVFGEFRGHDNPEIIMGLSPRPQVIFKTFGATGYDPVELQQKTGIPVVVLEYGDLASGRKAFFKSLEIAGEVMGKQKRAKAVIEYFNTHISQLNRRTCDIPDAGKKTCYVGGIAFKGPHGFQSTEPTYPPLQFINSHNVAAVNTHGKIPRQSNISKEKLLQWDPEVLLLDLSTLQLGKGAGGLHELKTDPVYRALSGVAKGSVFGVLPYNWYSMNQGSILANAWFIGKILYPSQFKDIDPIAKADEIYTFLVGKPVFREMNQRFQNMAFIRISHAF
ncbi:iron ABC transporter substrate-binding protein [Desulfocicer vacuolatum]|nr:iron ABC transporter substrate-binding protein [Desulfocicer vacuolatum]